MRVNYEEEDAEENNRRRIDFSPGTNRQAVSMQQEDVSNSPRRAAPATATPADHGSSSSISQSSNGDDMISGGRSDLKKEVESKKKVARASGRKKQQKHEQSAKAKETTTEKEVILGSNYDESFSSHQDGPERKSYKESQFERIMFADIVNVPDLKRLAWNGIPVTYRARAWKYMLGYLPTNETRRKRTLQRKRDEYKNGIQQHYDIHDDSRTIQEQETLRQVLVDVPRTCPEVPLFRDDRIRKMLARLLYIWAMRHPASSYVQGINDLATPLIAVFLSDNYNGQDVLDGAIMQDVPQEILDEVEADCYWCLTNLLAGIQDHYTSDQPGVQRMVLRLEELVNRIDSNLCEHLRNIGIQFLQFAFKWMNCLLLREFNLRCAIRLWDTYISEKDGFEDFHVYVCAAFLCQFSNELQAMEFDQLFGFMQDMPTQDWGDTEIEMLLSQAYVLSTLFGGSDAHLTSSQHQMTM